MSIAKYDQHVTTEIGSAVLRALQIGSLDIRRVHGNIEVEVITWHSVYRGEAEDTDDRAVLDALEEALSDIQEVTA